MCSDFSLYKILLDMVDARLVTSKNTFFFKHIHINKYTHTAGTFNMPTSYQ